MQINLVFSGGLSILRPEARFHEDPHTDKKLIGELCIFLKLFLCQKYGIGKFCYKTYSCGSFYSFGDHHCFEEMEYTNLFNIKISA